MVDADTDLNPISVKRRAARTPCASLPGSLQLDSGIKTGTGKDKKEKWRLNTPVILIKILKNYPNYQRPLK